MRNFTTKKVPGDKTMGLLQASCTNSSFILRLYACVYLLLVLICKFIPVVIVYVMLWQNKL